MARFNESSNGSMNTIIGERSRLEGEFEIAGSVKVEGTLKGRLRATERLVIGEGGAVLADIVVRDAIIGGEFTGTIDAESRVELEATARVRGELKTSHLVIQEGAVFQGNVESGEDAILAEDMGAEPNATAQDA